MSQQAISVSARLRSDLEPLPARMAGLPIDERGYVIPWFVPWINGVPEFRLAGAEKWDLAIRDSLCWVCGQRLGVWVGFTIGPMCAINRVTGEPPCHTECARWSARNCPFLTKPQMVRRKNDLPAGRIPPAGVHIERNPGAVAVWITKRFDVVRVENGGHLIELGDPLTVEWYAGGRVASREQVLASVESGLPLLAKAAEGEPDGAAILARCLAAAEALWPRA